MASILATVLEIALLAGSLIIRPALKHVIFYAKVKKEYIFTSEPHLLRYGVLWDNEYFSRAGEHTAEDPFPHCQWRGRGHVQRPPLYPTSEVRYDARGTERVRSVWSHLGATPFYTSKYRYLSVGMLGKRSEGKRIEVMSGRSYRLSVTSTKNR